MRADRLEVGHVLLKRTGQVIIQRVERTHGGVELLVKPVSKRKSAGSNDRILWFWGSEPVEVAPKKVPVAVSMVPGRAISSAKASQVALARRKAKP